MELSQNIEDLFLILFIYYLFLNKVLHLKYHFDQSGDEFRSWKSLFRNVPEK